MLINGSIASKKTDLLVENYAGLLNKNVNASKILVLVQNSSLKENFTQRVQNLLKIDVHEKLLIHSFFSLVYNAVTDNWAELENVNPFQNPEILPNLAGLEVSQFIMKDLLKDIKFKGYNSKKSLLHQLLRRYSLIVQNNLTDEEIDWRAGILKESFADDAKAVLKKFLSKTLQMRDFDYLRQTLVFKYIYKNTDYFKNIEYLFIDDADELTPAAMDFVRHLAPQLKDVFIAFDTKGASRSGYLSADRTSVFGFEELFNQPVTMLETSSNLAGDAEILFNNVKDEKKTPLKHFSVYSPSKRAGMIDLTAKKIKELLGKNVLPCEISIITPVIDDMLKFTLSENLKNMNIVYLSGNEKLIQNKLVLASLNILKLTSEFKNDLTEFDLRVVLSDFLGIPVKYCKEILENFTANKNLIDYNFVHEEHNEKYSKLLSLKNKLETGNLKLSEQVYEIFAELADFIYINPEDLKKFNFFIKQLQDFENIYKKEFNSRKQDIITQIENSIIAENPYSTLEISERDLIIGTPQKIIDNQVRTKYQFWLDTSSSEWIKSDTGPLYNAWVFQKDWNKDEFTIDDNLELGKDKTARILRKLTLCAEEHIYTLSSLFDGNGVENLGGIENYITEENLQENLPQEKTFKIVPREDQKPVLEYKSGKMAISAVPGAGKTTILLALIVKLLDRGVNPENIFVMTYMESAARNFRERIKNIRQNSSQLPNISTIHGLALRILKENGNFERLGLSSDFEICDDSQRTRIVREISTKLKLKKTETEEFDRACSVFKISQGIQPENITDTKIKKFFEFFNEYQRIMAEANLIDYDDMLISSVKLLEENEDILKHYQDICHYIIEDEAQDSSSIQQRLINLLSAKHQNLIRCGDINQAITTTFSNADVEGFRKFITESSSVSMDCSQRCTEDVWKLANTLVSSAENNEETKNAFFKIFMHPVEGKNPVQKNAVTAKIFENYFEERNYILKVIKNTFDKEPKATVGILLRNNYQVAQWQNFVNDSGLKSITRSECLEQKSIFKGIFAVMQMILTPFDNNVIADNYEILAELGLYKQRMGTEIRKLETPFVRMNCDDLNNQYLEQFYWDLTYWLSFPYLTAEELAIKIGRYYFKSEIEKSNVYLISTLIKRISTTNKNLSYIAERLGELAKKPSLSGFKFFSEEDESNREFLEGKVQIMTLHKSKGDEFDYVFIPEMTEKSLTLDFSQIKLKSSDFMENIRRLNPDYKAKTEFDLKQELISENLRLLYVAITRAKRKLFFTASTKTKSFEKLVQQEPSLIFTDILSEVQYE